MSISPQERDDLRVLTAEEVAALFGVCKQTVAAWRRSGKLPGFRLAGTVRFRAADIEPIHRAHIAEREREAARDAYYAGRSA